MAKTNKKITIDKTVNVIVVGAGAAGLFTALSLADQHQVLVLSNKKLGGICASCWAQGGIAAAVGPEDAPKKHQEDTLKAGAGTTSSAVARQLTEAAPHYIQILDKIGVAFEKNAEGHYKLSREACHGQRRVLKVKAGDGFGKELMRTLVEAVSQHPNIEVLEEVDAEKLLRATDERTGDVQGVLVKRQKDSRKLVLLAKAVVLATGGIGGLYEYTTNPIGAVGRGVAMAARAGAVLADLEFVQFHPTALDIGEDPAPLATEALRGEGAFLVNSRGERFMQKNHKMAELAPRDVVSRGIFDQIQKGQRVYLDCRHILVENFPALLEACARHNLDPKIELIPVMPATHYHMGGIATDLQGRTSLSGLWACGEVAATGLHGANRLASNSLMEAIVMGGMAAEDINIYLEHKKDPVEVSADQLKFLPESTWLEACVATIRHLMSEKVGVIRNGRDLEQSMVDFYDLEKLAEPLDAAVADMALMARLITTTAYLRKESRGGHCRQDYPTAEEQWQHRTFFTLKKANAELEALLIARKKVQELNERPQREIA